MTEHEGNNERPRNDDYSDHKNDGFLSPPYSDVHRRPSVIIEGSDDNFYERNKRTLLIGASAVIGILAVGGIIKSCTDDEPKPKTPSKTESSLSGRTFSELLNANSKNNSGQRVVLANFNIARVLNDDLAAGNNSVETLSVSTTACTTGSGSTVRPIKSNVSTIIFRNSESRNPFLPVILNDEHISATEKYRTNFREATKDSGYMHRDPTRMSKKNIKFIKSAVNDQLCPTGTTAIDPQISSRRLLIDDAAFEGRQLYDTNNRNPLRGVSNFFERIGSGGIILILVGLGAVALLSDGDFRSRFGRRKND